MSRNDLKFGGRMTDSTVFDGVSPDIGRPLYATEAGIASLAVSFNDPGPYRADRAASSEEPTRINHGYAWGFDLGEPVQVAATFAP